MILHEDRSDPIVAVAILYHVGSNREEKGHTGFTHLFEHMLFQESQHVGQDQFFKNIQDAGGTLNGGTWEDGGGSEFNFFLQHYVALCITSNRKRRKVPAALSMIKIIIVVLQPPKLLLLNQNVPILPDALQKEQPGDP